LIEFFDLGDSSCRKTTFAATRVRTRFRETNCIALPLEVTI